MLPSYQDKNSAMRSVLVAAYDLMQKEIKEFLIPCIRDDAEGEDAQGRVGGASLERWALRVLRDRCVPAGWQLERTADAADLLFL